MNEGKTGNQIVTNLSQYLGIIKWSSTPICQSAGTPLSLPTHHLSWIVIVTVINTKRKRYARAIVICLAFLPSVTERFSDWIKWLYKNVDLLLNEGVKFRWYFQLIKPGYSSSISCISGSFSSNCCHRLYSSNTSHINADKNKYFIVWICFSYSRHNSGEPEKYAVIKGKKNDGPVVL